MRVSWVWLGALVLGVSALSTVADASDSEIAADARSCALVPSPQARLECFDLMIGKHNLNAGRPARPSGMGAWNVTEDRSPVDDSRTLAAALQSTSVSGGNNGFGTPSASLFVRCRERQLDVFFTSSEFFGTSEDKGVLVRVGQEPARQERWSPSTNGRAVGIWGGSLALAFARELIATEATNLVIRADTFRGGAPITAQFTIAGARQALEPIVALCAPEPARPAAQPAPSGQQPRR